MYLISPKRQADDAACFDAQQEVSSTFPPLIPLLFVLQQTPISPLYFRFLFSVSSFMLCALP
jgi:hypothetical protein